MQTKMRNASLFLVTALAIGSILSVSAPAAPTARAATNLELCGTVNAYVKPSALLAGAITIGGTPWVIAAGADISGDVQVGARLCLRLTLSTGGSITDLVVVRADATSTLRICGVVTAYAKATAVTTGRLTIAGRTLTLAAGANLPASVNVGADLCATLQLNGFGQVKDGDVTANATSTLRICGVVSAFAEASPSSTGSLRIGGRQLVVAMGAELPAQVNVGADLCATLELNAFGQVQDGNVMANVTSKVEVCGVVGGFAAATATKTGSVSIGGRDFVVAMGADLPAQLQAGADLCATLELNAFGQVQDGTLSANVGSTLTVCGQVTAFSAATASSSGQLSIGGTSKSIAAGTNVDSRVAVGAFLRLRLTLNATGRVTDVAVLRVGVSISDACGDATATPPAPTPPTPTPSTGTGPTPTPTTGTGPTPTPTTGAGPTPTPTTGTGPTPTPSATATTGTGPAPTPTTGTGPTPQPSQPPIGTPDESPAPGEVCAPGDGSSGTGNRSGSEAAPNLPDTASPVERAGRVVATAAVPFLIFALTVIVASVIAWWRRRPSLELAMEGETPE